MIKLSVVVLTYNHQEYIRQALESILMQKVNFDFEVVILEDCSTDRTRDIILEYKNKFKNFKCYFNKRNHGGQFTWRSGRRHAVGQYYAPLEGDDYWTDYTKLQRQVDILDSAPELIGCAHNTEIDDGNSSCKKFIVESGQNLDTISLKDLIVGKAYFHTSSYLWRNIYSGGEPKEHFYHSAYMGDYFLSMLHAQHGDIGYIDEVMSCYRMTGRGTWTRFSERQRSQINLRCLFMYNKVLKYKYAHEFTRIWWGCDSEMKLLKEEGGNKLGILRLWLLRGSIDVRSNEYTRVWAEYLVKRREELNGKQSRLSKIIYTVLETWCLKQTAGNDEDLAADEMRGYTKHRNPVDSLLRKLSQFLWHAFYLWDVNRYFMYYKLLFFDWLKIGMYKRLDQ